MAKTRLAVLTAVLAIVWALQIAMLVPLPVTAVLTIAYLVYVARRFVVRPR
jgi:hypothetical protein